jgi:DNA-binding XRE family transcriptional regulator
MPKHTDPQGQEFPRRIHLSREELRRWLVGTPHVKPQEVERLRRRLELTQLELARWLGVTESSVSLWEAGKRRPRGPAHRLLRLIAELARGGEEGPGE